MTEIKCPFYPDCLGITFTPDEQTADGKPTFRTACAAGRLGGCNPAEFRSTVTVYDQEHSNRTQPDTPPVWADSIGRVYGPSRQRPGFDMEDRATHPRKG